MADASLDQMLRALSHPIRRRILRVLINGEGSATTISGELGLSLGVVSYHLNKVLAAECDIVELVDSIPRRGAIEKFYRLKLQPPEGDPGSGDGPGARQLSLEECFFAAVNAIDAA